MSDARGAPEGGDAAHALREPLRSMRDPLPVPTLDPRGAPFDVTIALPGSKSLTNRALLLAALAGGESTLRGALTDADDARVMIEALVTLGAGVGASGGSVRVRGVGGRFPGTRPVALRLGNAGTATRFLSAAALLAGAPVTIDGDPRMRERPIGALADSLTALGAGVGWLERTHFPPLRISPPTREALGRAPEEIVVASAESGQFVSALLLVAPFLARGLRLRIEGAPTSPSYIEMTLRLLRALGVDTEWAPGLREMRVAPLGARTGPLRDGFDIDIEPDASGAGYFWAAAAMVPGASCATPGIGTDSIQGDARLVEILQRMRAGVERRQGFTRVTGGAALRGVDADLSDMPDAAMTLAAIACFAEGPTTLRGLRTLRVKETDRLEALRVELTKIGARVEIIGPTRDPALRIVAPQTARGEIEAGGMEPSPAPLPPERREREQRGHARASSAPAPVEFESYADHRMAMALALIGLRRPGVTIRDPGCVAKTYPSFWTDLARLYGR